MSITIARPGGGFGPRPARRGARRVLTPVVEVAPYYSRSTDAVWGYERADEVNTLWHVTHLVTGLAAPTTFGTLDDGRAWTASATPVDLLTTTALELAKTDRTGLVALAVLAGELVHTIPDAHCICGGWVVNIDGVDRHVNACPQCFDVADPDAGLGVHPCINRANHRLCRLTPVPGLIERHSEAATCEHCPARDVITVICSRGAATCCGTCHED